MQGCHGNCSGGLYVCVECRWLKEQVSCKYNLKVIYCLRQFLLVAINVTLATVLIGYKVVQSLMLIYTTIVK